LGGDIASATSLAIWQCSATFAASAAVTCRLQRRELEIELERSCGDNCGISDAGVAIEHERLVERADSLPSVLAELDPDLGEQRLNRGPMSRPARPRDSADRFVVVSRCGLETGEQ
jgi:hypothetical protein